MRRPLIAAVLFTVLAAPAFAQRLPATVVPDHYDLAFSVDLANGRFSGSETIRVRLIEPTSRIVLNAVDLQFQEVTIVAGRSTEQATVSLNRADETAALTVAQRLPQGAAEIRIRYTAVLNDKLRGF